MTAFGPFESDPLGQLLDEKIRIGMERVIDLGVGFDANELYNAAFFRRMAVQKRIFILTSTRSQNTYGFRVRPHVEVIDGATTVQVVHVMTNGKIIDQDHFRGLLTLGRGEGGRIVARAGWFE
jgi:hypothetical protein